jgi:hypothetical protein
MWYILSVTSNQSVIFSVFPSPKYWPPRDKWNIVQSGIKHHNPNYILIYKPEKQGLLLIFTIPKIYVKYIVFNNEYNDIIYIVMHGIEWISLFKLIYISAFSFVRRQQIIKNVCSTACTVFIAVKTFCPIILQYYIKEHHRLHVSSKLNQFVVSFHGNDVSFANIKTWMHI